MLAPLDRERANKLALSHAAFLAQTGHFPALTLGIRLQGEGIGWKLAYPEGAPLDSLIDALQVAIAQLKKIRRKGG